MHSRPSGSPWLRWTGTVIAVVFLPAVFGLLPWHWRWLHLLPVEGVLGRLTSALLVGYINIQGAWLVAGILAATGLYFASAVSFWALKESIEERWIHVQAWHDRWRNWREERAERKAEFQAERSEEIMDEPVEAEHLPSRLASFFRRRGRTKAPPAPHRESPASGSARRLNRQRPRQFRFPFSPMLSPPQIRGARPAPRAQKPRG
jgi:hypothetical protein